MRSFLGFTHELSSAKIMENRASDVDAEHTACFLVTILHLEGPCCCHCNVVTVKVKATRVFWSVSLNRVLTATYVRAVAIIVIIEFILVTTSLYE